MRKLAMPAAAGLSSVALLVMSAAGCGLGYSTRTVWGGAKILIKRESIDRLVESARTDETLKQRLLLVSQIREFASQELGLPDNQTFRKYSEVRQRGKRSKHVVWNVVAAPEFSVEPLTWCFPIAGCVAYRGYFSETTAGRFASSLEKKNLDVDVYGVKAYSTLGRFADPVLSTFLDGSSSTRLAGYVFHELAHQVAYVKGDTTFNESFASFVEEEGLRRWLDSQGEGEQLATYLVQAARDGEFQALVLEYRSLLSTAYAQDRPDDWKRTEKTRLISQMTREYGVLKAAWGGDRRWDGWFDGDVNNADFALMASYNELVPSFRRLLDSQEADLSNFYAEVARIATLDRGERSRLLGPSLRRAANGP